MVERVRGVSHRDRAVDQRLDPVGLDDRRESLHLGAVLVGLHDGGGVQLALRLDVLTRRLGGVLGRVGVGPCLLGAPACPVPRLGGLGGAIGGAIGTKAVAGVVTAAVLTAGAAVELPVWQRPAAMLVTLGFYGIGLAGELKSAVTRDFAPLKPPRARPAKQQS